MPSVIILSATAMGGCCSNCRGDKSAMYYGEKLNSISHLVGAVMALIGLGALLTVGIQAGDTKLTLVFGVFGVAMVLLYTMSTLYHSFSPPRLKRLFKVLDHVSIYLLIAGTYTPLMLITVNTDSGERILALVWALAGIGILTECFLSGRAVKVLQMLIYVLMGWACFLDIGALKTAMPEAGFFWLIWGGVAYTVGVIFYIIDKVKWFTHAHGIWHFFVLGGSSCHFITVITYVR
jgi:hemolysin III